MMGKDMFPGDRQSQARPFDVAFGGRAALIEGVENFTAFIRTDPGPGIEYVQDGLGLILPQTDGDFSALWRIFDGIGQQVIDDDPQFFVITFDDAGS